jgi:hypothetical protein
MAFLTACKSKSQTEREMFWGIWDKEEKQAIGALFGRLAELMGITTLRMDDGSVVAVRPQPRKPVAKKQARGGKRRSGV